MNKNIRFIDDLTSDVMIEVKGKDLKELFSNIAGALFSIICEIKYVKPAESTEIEVEGTDEKDLLFNWLQELISRVDIEERFFSKFEILDISEVEAKDGEKKLILKARIWGEPFKPELSRTLVKAVTYYNFDLKNTKDGFVARVAFDI